MAPDELRGAVADRVGPRADRLMVEIAPQVVGELRDRRVAFRRILLQRLAEDRLEVAAQQAAQPIGRRRAFARPAPPASGERGAVHRRRQPQRLDFGDRLDELRRRLRRRAGRMLAGQQLVQQHAERVDVGRGGDGAARRPAPAPRTSASSPVPPPASASSPRRCASSSSSLAMPKSSSLTCPSASRGRSTASGRDGRSGWRARGRPRPARRGTGGCAPRRSSRSSSQKRSMWRPSMCSSTRYGWPVLETPASISRAMCGCVSRARIVPSRLKRSSPPRPTSAAFSSFSAAWPSKRPSLRDASHTVPMPPWPIGETSV